jgi:hypothetical protein
MQPPLLDDVSLAARRCAGCTGTHRGCRSSRRARATSANGRCTASRQTGCRRINSPAIGGPMDFLLDDEDDEVSDDEDFDEDEDAEDDDEDPDEEDEEEEEVWQVRSTLTS